MSNTAANDGRYDGLRMHLRHRVYDVADPRHIGVIRKIAWGHTATVEWEETGWISDVATTDLRFAWRIERN